MLTKNSKLRVVGSLTTMPNQYDKVIRTLESLHAQTYKLDAIYLSLPEISRRLGTKYPPVPKEISNKCSIISTSDYGPITKVSGALLAEEDPETIIITFDNDMVYPDQMVEKLIEYHKEYPNSAIGSAGMLLGRGNCPFCAINPNENNYLYNISKFFVPKEGRRIDSLYGYPGALYVRKFFPEKEKLEEEFFNYALINEATLLNDDIIISGYLSLKEIERRIFPNVPSVDFVKQDGERKRTEVEISYNMDKFFQRMNVAIETAKSVGMYAVTEPMNFNETIFGVAAIIVIVIIIILVICYLLINPPHRAFDL
jgi:hypothetical protein